MFSCNYCKYSTPYLHNLKRHVKNIHDKSKHAPLKIGAGPVVAMKQTIPYHSQNVKLSNQKAPTNNLLQPGAAYTSTAIPQHLTSYQVRQPVQNGSGGLHTTQQYDPRAIPQIQYKQINHHGHGHQHLTGYQVRQPIQNGSGGLHTTQQYDPRAKPQIQYNEVKHQGQGPQTCTNYSLAQNPVSNDNTDDDETDTETVSDKESDDDSDAEEDDIFQILYDIHLGFKHMKDLRDKYRKALPQLKQLDKDEMNQFLYEYAELKIDIIDEQDGLENRKVQTGGAVDGEYEEYENSEGDTDEEVVDEEEEEEANKDDEPNENDEPNKNVKPSCKRCLKERQD